MVIILIYLLQKKKKKQDVDSYDALLKTVKLTIHHL